MCDVMSVIYMVRQSTTTRRVLACVSATSFLIMSLLTTSAGSEDGPGSRTDERLYVNIGGEVVWENCFADPGANCAASRAAANEDSVSITVADASDGPVAFEWEWRDPSFAHYGGAHCSADPLVVTKTGLMSVVIRFYTTGAMNICHGFPETTLVATVGTATFEWT